MRAELSRTEKSQTNVDFVDRHLAAAKERTENAPVRVKQFVDVLPLFDKTRWANRPARKVAVACAEKGDWTAYENLLYTVGQRGAFFSEFRLNEGIRAWESGDPLFDMWPVALNLYRKERVVLEDFELYRFQDGRFMVVMHKLVPDADMVQNSKFTDIEKKIYDLRTTSVYTTGTPDTIKAMAYQCIRFLGNVPGDHMHQLEPLAKQVVSARGKSYLVHKNLRGQAFLRCSECNQQLHWRWFNPSHFKAEKQTCRKCIATVRTPEPWGYEVFTADDPKRWSPPDPFNTKYREVLKSPVRRADLASPAPEQKEGTGLQVMLQDILEKYEKELDDKYAARAKLDEEITRLEAKVENVKGTMDIIDDL